MDGVLNDKNKGKSLSSICISSKMTDLGPVISMVPWPLHPSKSKTALVSTGAELTGHVLLQP